MSDTEGRYLASAVRRCPSCPATFTAKQANAMYCSSACKLREWKKRGRAGSARQAFGQERRCADPQCGQTFNAAAPHQKFCTGTCRERFHNRLKPQAGGTHRRRARLYGVKHERFDKMEVFERDGWKCRLCGCDCPRSLTGTTQPNAPELDHIVTFARGGEHVKSNTQLACRRCNQRKGAGRWVVARSTTQIGRAHV